MPRSSIASARNSAAALVPNQITGPRATSANRATRSSSAFSTAVALGHGRFSISSRSASAISSTEEKNSRCSTATRVTTPTSGARSRVSAPVRRDATSPVPRPPRRAPRSSFSSVSGRPYSLFRFPCVFSTRNRAPSSAARISFVVVLPTDPATAADEPPRPLLPPDFARAARPALQSRERVVHGEEPRREFPPGIPRDARAPPPRPQRRARAPRPQNRVHRDAVRVWR